MRTAPTTHAAWACFALADIRDQGLRPPEGCPPWRAWGKKKPRPRRSFTPEFKAEIVELCRRGDRTIGQVARDFDLTETAVRLWVGQARADHGEKDGLSPGQS
ncbi:transposase [Streptomyces abyssomicinicus]|uniref:transposase n=1 Tax=Streptomyces abyssomicinicus TaxID=574929 RepID=UPI001250BB59